MIRVSTIIPVYNNATTVAQAIDSALVQEFEGQEVIVVNDGSTDATSRILEGYGRKINVVTQPNRGRAAARNAALAVAKGEYVAFLDADDEWLPHKLARLVPVLDADSGCVLVYSDALVVDSEGRVVRNSVVPPEYAHPPTFDELLQRGAWDAVLSSIVMRRSVIKLCGGFDESFGRHWGGQDYFLLLQARESGPFCYLPDTLVRFKASTLTEHLRKRQRGACANGDSVPAANRLRWCFGGEDCFIELVMKRYGKKGIPVARRLTAQKQRLLLPIAMLAMHDGDRWLARRAYLSLVRYDPLHPETYARLLWTFLPARMNRPLSWLLPEKYQRALMGPPEDWLGCF
jgi:glycosyltransferase involved in cell wall biosynthesis